jgi:LuxR family maltose regulon positive regulatory protein
MTAAGHGQRAAQLIGEDDAQLPWLAIPVVRIHLLAGRFAQARKIAGEALLNTVTRRERLHLTMLDAFRALRMGDTAQARVLMTMAIDVYRETGILRAFSGVPGSDRPQLIALVPDYPDAARLIDPVYPDQLVEITLSDSERALLAALASTSSRREMATQLFITHNTVKTRLARLYRKLGVATRDEALYRATQLGP